MQAKSQESSTPLQVDAELRALPTATLTAVAATLLSGDLESFTREAWHLMESAEFIPATYWTSMCEWSAVGPTASRRSFSALTFPRPRAGVSVPVADDFSTQQPEIVHVPSKGTALGAWPPWVRTGKVRPGRYGIVSPTA